MYTEEIKPFEVAEKIRQALIKHSGNQNLLMIVVHHKKGEAKLQIELTPVSFTARESCAQLCEQYIQNMEQVYYRGKTSRAINQKTPNPIGAIRHPQGILCVFGTENHEVYEKVIVDILYKAGTLDTAWYLSILEEFCL